MHSTPQHPQSFQSSHTNQNEPQRTHPRPRLFRFSYRLQFYNSLQKFYKPPRQALIQQPLRTVRDQSSLMSANRVSPTSPTKTSFHTKLHHPPTNSLLFSNKLKLRASQEGQQQNLSREKEQRMVWQNGRQVKEEAKISKMRDSLEMFPQIYEQEEEESDSYQIREKIDRSNSNSAAYMQQQENQNIYQNYQGQSVTPVRPQTKNINHYQSLQPHTPTHTPNYYTPLFISERNNESEMSCSQKKCYQRRNITSRYQSPEDMAENQSQVQKYLQLMQQQIKTTLYGQNIEAYIKSWIIRNNYAFPHFTRSTPNQKTTKQTHKQQRRTDRESQMQLTKQAEPMENESSIVQPGLQGGEQEDYRLAGLEAIFNYQAPEFCFRDNQEEQQLFQLNQFLLN